MRAINPETGEVIEYRGGRWVPVQEAGPAAPKPAAAAPAGDFLQSQSWLGRQGEAALVGAGDVFATVGRNVRDVGAWFKGDEQARQAIEAERSEAQRLREGLREGAPIGATVGAMAPFLAAAPLAGTGLLAQAGMGAATGALGSESGEFGADAALGGALSLGGQIAGRMVSRVKQGVQQRAITRAADEAAESIGVGGAWAGGGGQRMTQAYRDNLEAGKRIGMQTTLGMETGDRFLKQAEDAWKVSPVMAKPFLDVDEANRAVTVGAALRAMGQEGDSITPAVMQKATERFGDWGDSIAAKVGNVEVTGLRDKLQKIAGEHAKEGLPDPKVPAILARFESGAEARALSETGERALGDAMSGRQLMTMRSTVLDEMQAAYRNGRPGVGKVFADFIDTIDAEMAGAVGRAANAMGGADKKAAGAFLDDFRNFRDSYKVFAAVSEGTNQVGELMPGRIAAALRRNDKTGFARGGIHGTGKPGENAVGDFYDAIRFLNGVGRDALPLTGARTAMASMFQGEGIKARALATFLGSPAGKLYLSADPRVASHALQTLDEIRKAEAQRFGQITGAGLGAGAAAGIAGGM